jgi:hypothetical protein
MIGRTISHHRITIELGETRDQHAFGKKSHGGLYGQETRTHRSMRISLIIVR